MELQNVGYLEDVDFDSNGNLINSQIKDKVVVILIFASWCGHCKNFKPIYQEFATKMNGSNVFVAAIQDDGERESEKRLMKKIKTIKSDFRGFPDVVLYKNGRRVDKDLGDRSLEGLMSFVKV